VRALVRHGREASVAAIARESAKPVVTGIFGAVMQVALVNDVR
jgi:D-Tyr-tRNAtyr deacylase